MKAVKDNIVRIRLLFMSIMVLVCSSLGLLIYKAQQAEELQSIRQHEAIADRIFSELERQMNDFISTEEARSIDEFSNKVNQRPNSPYVIGYVQTLDDTKHPTWVQPYLQKITDYHTTTKDSDEIPQTADPPDTYSAQKLLNSNILSRKQRAYEAPNLHQRFTDVHTEEATTGSKEAQGTGSFQGFVEGDTLILLRDIQRQGQSFRQAIILRKEPFQQFLSQSIRLQLQPRTYMPTRETKPLDWFAIAWRAQDKLNKHYQFEHIFTEPFSTLHVTVHIDKLKHDSLLSLPVLYFLILVMLVFVGGSLTSLYRTTIISLQLAEQRSNFVSAITHELKTPITSIQMYSEMLEQNIVPTSERRNEYYQTIRQEAQRLGSLIENVLLFAQLEQGQSMNSPNDGSLHDVIQSIKNRYELSSQEHGYSLHYTIQPESKHQPVPTGLLIQILTNLIDNSVKFSTDAPDKSIQIISTLTPQHISLKVRDHGPGIPTEQLTKVTEAFVRLEREQTRKTKGTGIGLALVHNLVLQLNGILHLQNHPEGGLEATVRLPINTEETR